MKDKIFKKVIVGVLLVLIFSILNKVIGFESTVITALALIISNQG